MSFGRVLATLALLMLTGCAAHRQSGAFRTLVSPSCLTAPVVMKDCNSSGNLTHCRLVELRYPPGCEQIQVKKADQAQTHPD